jgi:hypothetical protein
MLLLTFFFMQNDFNCFSWCRFPPSIDVVVVLIATGPGVTSVGSGGFIPYPGYKYFRNDMWYYNLSSSLWVEVVPEPDSPLPDPRVDPIFLLLGNLSLIFMHGTVRCALLLHVTFFSSLSLSLSLSLYIYIYIYIYI